MAFLPRLLYIGSGRLNCSAARHWERAAAHSLKGAVTGDSKLRAMLLVFGSTPERLLTASTAREIAGAAAATAASAQAGFPCSKGGDPVRKGTFCIALPTASLFSTAWNCRSRRVPAVSWADVFERHRGPLVQTGASSGALNGILPPCCQLFSPTVLRAARTGADLLQNHLQEGFSGHGPVFA